MVKVFTKYSDSQICESEHIGTASVSIAYVRESDLNVEPIRG